MSNDNDTELGFAALDALLDQALSLTEEELPAFLASLPPPRREALINLMRRSESGGFEQIAAAVQDAVDHVAQQDVQHHARSPETVEQTAGQWHLKKEIGTGGMGQVFYAERREADLSGDDGEKPIEGYTQRAAVKVLWSHRVSSQFKDRFLRERRILASIEHPGLARFLDGGLLGDDRPWFAMEFVDGVDIVTYATGLSVVKKLGLFLAVCETLEYAHQRLIVHRDIKPQNVLVDASGRPRVLDFGIARILGDVDQEGLTRVQGTPLTLQYASPEQVTGRSVDVASDVYQLGLLLHQMLTGQVAYEIDETSLSGAIQVICEKPPAPPSSQVPAMDGDLDAIVGQALRKNPSERYASAAALADDVRRYLDDRPVMARPHSAWYVATRFIRRQALLVSVVSVSVIALAAATVFSVQMAFDARREAERSRTTQQILADVFQQADPFGDSGADVTLADALISAKPMIENRIAADPRLAWEVNKTLSEIFSSLDLLELERQAYDAALAAAKQLGGADEVETLYAVAGIGNTLARTDPGAAVAFLSEHLVDAPARQDAAVEWLSAKYAEVNAWIRLRDFEQVDQGAHRMADIARQFEIESPRTLGRINTLLAGAARRAGDLPAADEHWAQAVEYMRLADQPAGHAITLSNMALHFAMTGRYEQSDAVFRQAIAVFREFAPEDSSHADVLRLYAGLLFRMERPEEAIRTLREALSILDPDKHSYAYFVAQTILADFTFVTGDTNAAFDAIKAGLDVALAAFGHDSDVTGRMRPRLARLLVFADQHQQAAVLLGLDETLRCGSDATRLQELHNALRELSDLPTTEASRQAVMSILAAAGGKAQTGALDADAFAATFAAYRDEHDVFFDSLDRWRFLNALRDVATAAGLTPNYGLDAELEALASIQAEARAMLTGRRAAEARALLLALDPALADRQASGQAFTCPE